MDGRIPASLALLGLFLFARPARASGRDSATAVVTLPEIHVVADRPAQNLVSMPMATTVIDRKAIEASGAVDLGEILRPVVGVRVASLGGVGAFTPVSIRGSTNDQVVVLIDGRRLNAAQGGGADLADIPLTGLERIEIARGGGSALYGPDAIGGVINLVTRPGSPVRSGEFRAEMGSFGTRLLGGRIAGGGPGAAGRLGGRLLLSRGDYAVEASAGQAGRRANGRLDSRYLDSGLTFRPRWASRFDLRASHYHAEKGVPGAVQFPSPTAVQRDEVSAADFELRGLLPAGSAGLLSGRHAVSSVTGFVQRQIRWYDDPGYPLGAVTERHRNDALGASLVQTRRLGAAGTVTAGVEYRADHLRSTTDGAHGRPAGAFFTRGTIAGGAGSTWQFTPALRYDAVDGYRGFWSPRILGRWLPRPGLELRGSVGRSFRPPSFDDLFLPARATAAGNPDLRPERAFDFDCGFSVSRSDWSLGATGFHNRVTDLIQWEPGALGAWRPHNVAGARIVGIEAEVLGRLAGVHVEANYTFLDPRDAGREPNTGGRVLVYRPRHRANLQLRFPIGRWSGETQWRYTGPVFITRANTKSLPGYVTVDAVLRWQARAETTFEIRALNLGNQRYQDIRDYPVPGRQWRVAASWRIGGRT